MNMTFIRCEKLCDLVNACIIWWIRFTVSDSSQKYLLIWCDSINCVSSSSYRFFTCSANHLWVYAYVCVAVAVCNCVNFMRMHYIITAKKKYLCSSEMIFHLVWKYSQVKSTHMWMRCARVISILKIKSRHDKTNIQVFSRQSCVWHEYPKKLCNFFKWARMGSLCVFGRCLTLESIRTIFSFLLLAWLAAEQKLRALFSSHKHSTVTWNYHIYFYNKPYSNRVILFKVCQTANFVSRKTRKEFQRFMGWDEFFCSWFEKLFLMACKKRKTFLSNKMHFTDI